MSEGLSTEVSAEACKVECSPAENPPSPTSASESLQKTGDLTRNCPDSFPISSISAPSNKQETDLSLSRKTAAHHGAVSDLSSESPVETDKRIRDSLSKETTRVCSFYVKSGWCRFGQNCRYLHPRLSKSASQGLNSKDKEPKEASINLGTVQGHGEAGTILHSEQPVCRFFARSGWCRYGYRCKFAHVPNYKTSHRWDDGSSDSDASILWPGPKTGELDGEPGKENVHEVPDAVTATDAVHHLSRDDDKPSARSQRCRFYDRGFCRMGENCRFLHQAKFTERDITEEVEAHDVEDDGEWQPARKPTARPGSVTSRPLTDLQDGDAAGMREVEIGQLKKRFPRDKLELVGSEHNPSFRFTIVPSDPDWPYDLRDFDVQITFPVDYPIEVFRLEMPEDQVLPSIILKHMSEAITEWLMARYATNQLSGRVELMVRPFLRWFDRNLMRLFTEGARKFKKEVYARAAGFEFISYAEQGNADQQDDVDAPVHPKEAFINTDMEGNIEGSHDDYDDDGEEEVGEEDGSSDEEVQPSDPLAPTERDVSLPVSLSSKYESPTENRRGTEIRFPQMELSESAATLTCEKIKLCIQCSRCKEKTDMSVAPGQAMVLGCSKCQSQQAIAYRSCIIHHFSSVLGFLDLTGCIPVDLIIFECGFLVSCLDCSEETNVQGIQYGQGRQIRCLSCHKKMSVAIESAKFQRLIASVPEGKTRVVAQKRERRVQDSAIREGFPLPANGTCKHYKKSFRWLRFPCCGKCYPCDECHDLAEPDHEMKYATRMICGFCCKEQQYSVDKPCVACGSSTTKSRTSHWEGGMGCRNKTKMNRNDKQKFSSINKTTSRRAQKLEESKKGNKK